MAAVDPHRAFRIQCSAVRRARAAVQIRSGPPMVTACVSCVNDGKLSPSSRQIGCRRRLASRQVIASIDRVLGWQIVLILCLLDQLGCKVAVLDVVMFVDMDFQNKLIDSLSREPQGFGTAGAKYSLQVICSIINYTTE
ncbi:uncharacterized protein LOC127779735 [Oryza glaberrima]|uniref:Uncharacterized protein n=1 Tax=Oryza glaberrima TaxID=4538 RepID=I1Q9U9_ORYGL|nr:uncharacterized protein LOC127779735 [Oryza glaberrima]